MRDETILVPDVQKCVFAEVLVPVKVRQVDVVERDKRRVQVLQLMALRVDKCPYTDVCQNADLRIFLQKDLQNLMWDVYRKPLIRVRSILKRSLMEKLL